MVLSNAERQARFQKRLRERAASAAGVTPDMVVAATKLIFEWCAADDPSIGTWDEFLVRARQKRNRDSWRNMVPDDLRPDSFDFLDGEDRALVEKVAAVINAATFPPSSETRPARTELLD